MDHRLITAIFPRVVLDQVEADLQDTAIPGMTVSHAHGFGEYRNFYTRDTMTDCVRVEIYCSAAEAESFVSILCDVVNRHSPEGALVAVSPVETLIRTASCSGGSGSDA